ncbi:MAG: ABC transporter permease [Rhodospirillales bacterium]|nr:ABC transporter permease [Rhodospirillales bacterium]
MTGFLARRLGQALAVLAVMSFVVYGLIGLMPGDPIDLMISSDPRLGAEDALRLKQIYGLDRPLIERYAAWAQAALTGDLGYSRLQARPVAEVLRPALEATARLAGLALVLSLSLALPLGLLAATRRERWIDRLISLVSFAGISTPPFWTALVLIIVFAVLLGILPAGGSGAGDGRPFAGARHLVLPVLCLALASVGGYVRYVRAATIDALGSDWIRTARAKGLSDRQVVLGHALRIALVPVVTVLGIDFGALVSGALVTETVFAYPGMGRLIYDAILGNDYNLALAALLLATAFTLAGSLLADLALVLLDPRIALDRADR